jgi:hypothetical protein
LLPQRRRKGLDIEPASKAEPVLDRRDAVGIIGFVALCVSVGLISPPAGGIIFGIGLLLAAFLL